MPMSRMKNMNRHRVNDTCQMIRFPLRSEGKLEQRWD